MDQIYLHSDSYEEDCCKGSAEGLGPMKIVDVIM